MGITDAFIGAVLTLIGVISGAVLHTYPHGVTYKPEIQGRSPNYLRKIGNCFGTFT